MDPALLAVLALVGLAWYFGSGAGGVTTGSVGPGGGRTAAPPGSGAQPGGGGGSGIGPGIIAAAPGLVPIVKGAIGQIQPGSVPSPPLEVLRLGADPGLVEATATMMEMTPAAFEAWAASMNLTGAQAATFVQEAAFMSGGLAPPATITTETVGAFGSQVGAFVGWALPIAAAIAIGGMILKAALTRRGSFAESKDRARGSVNRLGMDQAYRIADAVLDSLLATGRPPAQFTQEAAIQTGYVFANWYDNVDSFHDVFQGEPGGLAAAEALRQKALAYYGRVAEIQGWRTQLINFVQQGDQSWGRTATPQFYIEEIGRQIPPPDWYRRWQEFAEFAALGYAGMLDWLREQVQWETVGRWAGEGGNQ